MATQVKPGVRMEDLRGRISEKELSVVGETYADFYKWKAYRGGLIKQFQNHSFEDMLIASRQLFWNSVTTDSDDLRALGLDFSIPFARKETMDFLGRITSLNIKPHIEGDELDSLGMKVMGGMYKKWRFHSNDKVEKFWEMLYGLVNGTVCSYIGFTNTKLQRRYLRSYNEKDGTFSIEKKDQIYWNDVSKEIVPIEDIYLPKIYERNIQKQGSLIWKTQMDENEFHSKYDLKYENAKFVVAGNRIAEDSLYYRLLGGSGTTSYNKIEILNKYNWEKDEHTMIATGILLNKLGTNENPTVAPMPFDHKMAPFTWGITSPLDEKIAYGLPTPFLVKDPHKILNVGYTMMVERELRAIDPPVLSSDIESPELIYGQHKVINVNDVEAYKEFKISEPSNQYFAMLNSLQSQMTAQAKGGDTDVVPSRQPASASEINDNANQQQEAMANTVVMYYDLIRQEVLLVLKTACQFYTNESYQRADARVYRDITVGDSPLTLGGMGNMNIRIVDKKKSDLELWLEGIKTSAIDGKQTEIVEVPKSFLQQLELYITKIELEPDNNDQIELASFVANVINPMIQTYIPMGVADPHKTFLRHMEKMGESPADFAADANTQKQGQPQQQNGGGGPTPMLQGLYTPQPGGGAGPKPPGQQINMPAVTGNLNQSITGTKFGSRNNRGLQKKTR